MRGWVQHCRMKVGDESLQMFSNQFHLKIHKMGVSTDVCYPCFLFQTGPPVFHPFLFDGELFQRCFPMLCPFSPTLKYTVQHRVTCRQTISSELWHCPCGFCSCTAEAFDLLSALSHAKSSFCESLVSYSEFLFEFQ